MTSPIAEEIDYAVVIRREGERWQLLIGDTVLASHSSDPGLSVRQAVQLLFKKVVL